MKQFILFLAFIACIPVFAKHAKWENASLCLGDELPEVYLPLLQGQRVAIFSNQTGCNRKGEHVLDVLLREGVNVTTLFSPEHGFRGTADAGERVSSSKDPETGIPILSLYDGGKKGPSNESMRRFDVLVVDIQDVGLRFYTYYVSMLQLMNRCGETGRKVVIMDRPNPNGHYVDGPILDMSLKSGIGALPIPIVHGMTLGELALMAQGEGWVEHPCNLSVVPCQEYSHKTMYRLPIAPSPNLPNMQSIYLYPSTCLFEGTCFSLGRGTDHPFQVWGHPEIRGCAFSFTPESRPGAKNPPLLNERCYGEDLTGLSMGYLQQLRKIDMSFIVDAFTKFGQGEAFFGTRARFFDLLTGQTRIREMILQGHSASEIEQSWENDVRQFKEDRKKYLLYEE